MKFNQITADRLGLVEDTLYHCGLPTVTASYSSYALADITRNINNSYLDTVRKIWDFAAGWQYDDSNKTTLPVGYTTVVHNQNDYSLPTDAQRVQRVEIKDSAGDYQLLKQIDIHDITNEAMSEFLSTPGLPQYYDLVGRSVMLYPTPSSAYCTLASGMAVYMDREPTLFTTASTTAEPGFASPFHKILSYSAAIDFVQDKASQDRLVAMKARLEQGLKEFYSKRNVERRASIRPSGKKNWRNYV
jgi:hypothetical protein